MNDITRDGNPVLRKRAEKLTFPLDPKYLKVADEMMEYLKNSQDPKIAQKYHLRAGVGLAAPQIGLSIQMPQFWFLDQMTRLSLKKPS